MLNNLWGCVLTRWQPGFNDPYFLSWLMVSIYLFAAVLALVVAGRVPFPAETRRRERIVWAGVATVAVVMAVNKQADLQTLAIAAGSCVVRGQGWDAQALWLETVTTGALALLTVGVGGVFLWSLRGTAGRTALPLLGLALMVGFVAFRAAEILGFLGPLYALTRSLWVDRVLELAGPALVILGALRLLRRPGGENAPRGAG